jgi:large subunit ribosomal protein L31
MKAAIHPNYFASTFTCACGNVINTGSTKEAISIELCSACHPFYTGQLKIMDTARRVEKFTQRATKKTDTAIGHAAKEVKKLARAKARQEKREKAEMAQ